MREILGWVVRQIIDVVKCQTPRRNELTFCLCGAELLFDFLLYSPQILTNLSLVDDSVDLVLSNELLKEVFRLLVCHVEFITNRFQACAQFSDCLKLELCLEYP